MKTLKILTMMIWLFLLSYIPIKIGIDRNLTFYFIPNCSCRGVFYSIPIR